MTKERKYIKKTLFVLSDPHGHLSLMRKELENAGFDPDNTEHLLVILGDYFDRGKENREMLEYLSPIKNKVLIRGNHEDILLETLNTGIVGTLQENNGTVNTLYDFFDDYSGTAYLPMRSEAHAAARRTLLDFIYRMPLYFESEHYVFTHGWLPMHGNDRLRKSWRTAPPTEWKRARWLRWKDLYGRCELLPDKTLVIGHTPVIYYATGFDPTRHPHDSTPFCGEGMIAIDATTVSTGRVNLLVIEDGVPESLCHRLSVTPEKYDRLISTDPPTLVTKFGTAVRDLMPRDRVEISSEGRETISFSVVSVHSFPTFAELEDNYAPEELGCEEDLCEITSAFRSMYSFEELADDGLAAVSLAKI